MTAFARWLPGARARLQQARDREFRLLQTDPESFPGIVWGCTRWRRCGDRIIETPPYAARPDPAARCMDHGLPMTTKIVESRVIADTQARRPDHPRSAPPD